MTFSHSVRYYSVTVTRVLEETSATQLASLDTALRQLINTPPATDPSTGQLTEATQAMLAIINGVRGLAPTNNIYDAVVPVKTLRTALNAVRLAGVAELIHFFRW